MSTLKKVLLAAVVSIATLTIAAVGAEIYLRLKVSPNVPPYLAEFYTHDGRKISAPVGAIKLGLAPYTLYQTLPSQHTSNFNINSRGFRGDEEAEQDSRPKIIFVGGSAAFGQGAETDTDTIPAILQQSISSHRFINAGVIGFVSGQELTYLITDMIDYQPAIVVAYDGWNDAFDGALSPTRGVNKLGFNNNFYRMEDELALNYRTQISWSASLFRFLQVSWGKSLVLRRFSRAVSSRQEQSAIRTIKDLPEAQQKDLMARIVNTYVRNVRKMALFSRASGSKFLLVFQPELGQRVNTTAKEKEFLTSSKIGNTTYNDLFPLLYRQFLAEAKPLLTQAGVAWIDVNESPLYQSDPQTLFSDPVHTNRRGNDIAAQSISEKLRSILELK